MYEERDQQTCSWKKSITIDIFIDIIKKEWKEIESEILLNLVYNMSKRLE